ncbi:drug:proton antiporter [Aureimonas endophytica]|uniref:Drug:proton antiporter n=1 Tax=Aureimonas endophytica TaxID=2027858 RepID=A0A916ZWE9_9HYPH|nr:VOC family protein [Aureimonas endophytica]GGE16195.1 drug:proton antiporter [Aureimonas endophytica]
MLTFGLAILYVDDPAASARFYAGLFGEEPVELSPSFAMFALRSGLRLGLWSRHTVTPGAAGAGGGTELAFLGEDIDAIHADWAGRGIPILQPPVDLDFGRAFVALDPDGHRLRIYRPAPE